MKATFSLLRTKNDVGFLAECSDTETADKLQKLFTEFLEVIERAAEESQQLSVTYLIK